jgi:hypothetical protein
MQCNQNCIFAINLLLPKKKVILGWYKGFLGLLQIGDEKLFSKGVRKSCPIAWNSQKFLKFLYALCNVIKIAFLLPT